ncbi:MAG: MGMT family protein [Prevotella multiformis]|uniref:MGMT family protein n=1 Tax=Prevotella multiformis TaxID=282402 RepID=UPI003F9F8D4E
MAVDIALFRKEVYSVVASIPRGKVLSYGQVAWLVGCPDHARLVGRVLHGTVVGAGVPCHRVVNSAGRMAPGWPEQHLLLEAEGITFRPNGCVDMKKWQWKLDE